MKHVCLIIILLITSSCATPYDALFAKAGADFGIEPSLPDGKIIEGQIKISKRKLIEAWIEIHQDELMADWELAISGEEVFKIDPLR